MSKENSLVLRGMAIVFVVLHNFLHLGLWGFSRENEMKFVTAYADSFFSALASGDNLAVQFFSHLGWIGVAVFVFLTGYGASFIHIEESSHLKRYIRRNYLKLLALMLPALLFFMAVDVVKGLQLTDFLKRTSYLTMLVNFAYPYLKCSPGVYWYFGLTFQFYLLWACWGRRMNWRNLLFWSCAAVAGLVAVSLYGSAALTSIYKHCFMGWFPVFAVGVWMGKGNISIPQKSVWTEVSLTVLFLAMMLLASSWMLTWTILPVVALAWFLCVGSLLLRTGFLADAFRWLGRLSACIFVCHPIARIIVLNTLHPRMDNLMVNVLAYLVLTLAIALFYDRYYKWFTARIIKK